MSRFRLSAKRAIKATLVNEEGKLLTSIYDSGFSALWQVESALLSKCTNPPRKTYFCVYDEETDTYWSNRIR